jgi:hypothetical protein
VTFSMTTVGRRREVMMKSLDEDVKGRLAVQQGRRRLAGSYRRGYDIRLGKSVAAVYFAHEKTLLPSQRMTGASYGLAAREGAAS